MRSPHHPSSSPQLKSPAHPGSGGGKPGFRPGAGQENRRRNELIGQTVKIVCGPYKGLCYFKSV